MAVSFQEFARELRSFDDRRVVLNQLRKDIRKPLPTVRKAIRARAMATLPESGGLNVWVSKTRITVQVRATGRRAGITLKGSRKSAKDKSDLKRLDQGRVRHPSWGRRGKGQWHVQSVTPGFFTDPATEVDQWIRMVEAAVDRATAQIRGG